MRKLNNAPYYVCLLFDTQTEKQIHANTFRFTLGIKTKGTYHTLLTKCVPNLKGTERSQKSEQESLGR